MRVSSENWLVVVGVLLFASALRIAGLSFGQTDAQYNQSLHPMLHMQAPLHPDEYFYVSIPLEMRASGRANPQFFENPSLLINLNYITYFITGTPYTSAIFERDDAGRRSYAAFPLYLIGRVYSMLGGVLAVAAGYGLARLMMKNLAASLSALLMAMSYPLIQHSHYATTSSLAAGFTMLCLWACAVTLKQRQPRLRFFLLAGIAAGLAAGSRYNAAAVSLSVLVTGCILLYRHHNFEMFRFVVWGWIAFPLTFFMTSPYVLLDFPSFWSQFRMIYLRFSRPTPQTFTTLQGLLLEYRYIIVFGISLPAALLLPVAIVRGLIHQKSRLLLLVVLSFALPYSLIVLDTPHPEVGDQLTVPIIPALIVILGIGFAWVYQRWKWFGLFLSVSAVAYSAVLMIPLVRLFVEADTRIAAQTWVYDNLPHDAAIQLVGAYNVPLDTADYNVRQEFNMQADLADVEYVIISDAVLMQQSRLSGKSYDELLSTFLSSYDSLQQIASFRRPRFAGYEWLTNNATYWHHPSLFIYCLNAAACAK